MLGPTANTLEAGATGLSTKQLDRIKRNKAQAKIRKTARLVEQAKLVWAPALTNNSNPGGIHGGTCDGTQWRRHGPSCQKQEVGREERAQFQPTPRLHLAERPFAVHDRRYSS